jgi:uncharacterized protein (TIGR01777 family)
MRVLITGATGTIGGAVASALLERGDAVAGLTRDPARAGEREPRVEWHPWRPTEERPPEEALAGVDAVVNLVGEPINQRWTDDSKRRIMDSRRQATHNLVQAILTAPRRPSVLVSGSAVGYYGDRGDTVIDETAEPGSSFDAQVCAAWEEAAREVEPGGVRLAIARTGLVLDAEAGLLSELLTPFRLGVGGPVAGGRAFMPWIALEDEVGLLLWLLDTPTASGAYNLTAPNPVTNRDFSKALGRALGRPAVVPVPKLAVKTRFGGEFGEIAATAGQRAIPARAQEGGYEFRHSEIDEALRSVLA